MNIIPIAFAFDNNLCEQAAICIFSLLSNAKKNTFYDIFIISAPNEDLKTESILKVTNNYNNCKVTFRKASTEYENSFHIRGINSTTYYRLLIPEIIPEYDKIIYSDVDVIFRNDLASIYNETSFNNELVAGVRTFNNLIPAYSKHYISLGIDPADTVYAGNIIINSKLMREENICHVFKNLSGKKFIFQDMDILNIVCKNRIFYLPPSFCLTTFINDWACNNRDCLLSVWTNEQIDEALKTGIVHYNGPKPWKSYCPSFDIWWEYYRKSPLFDAHYYFNFFYNKLDELDTLSLWKRIKILIRYFIVGKRKIQS